MDIPNEFYKVRLSYVNPAYGYERVDNFAVAVGSIQAFTDSVLDTFGSDCSVMVLEKFSMPIDRYWYRLL